MSCLKPFTRVVKNRVSGLVTEYPNASCGKCRGCRKELRRQWYMRMSLEHKSYDKSCFITLTYADNPVTLDKVTCQKFLDRLRKRCGPFRYFLVGEYGDKTKRPHYHAIIFGLNFRDSRSYRVPGGYYSHPDLDSAWGRGHCTIGEVTPASIKYCSHYVMKRFVSKKTTALKYLRAGGELVIPEFSLKSTRPALGRAFFNQYRSQLADQQTVVVDGLEMLMPRYFFRLLDDAVTLVLETAKRDLIRFPMSEKELTRYKDALVVYQEYIKNEDFMIFSEEDANERERLLDVAKRKAILEVQYERNSAVLKAL